MTSCSTAACRGGAWCCPRISVSHRPNGASSREACTTPYVSAKALERIPRYRLVPRPRKHCLIHLAVNGVTDHVHRAIAEEEVHPARMITRRRIGVENKLVVGDVGSAAVRQHEG